MPPEDYYDVLGIDWGASSTRIKAAYREKTKEYHPDVGGSDMGMQTLTEARDVLLDRKKRTVYHRLGHDEFVEKYGGIRFTSDDPETWERVTPESKGVASTQHTRSDDQSRATDSSPNETASSRERTGSSSRSSQSTTHDTGSKQSERTTHDSRSTSDDERRAYIGYDVLSVVAGAYAGVYMLPLVIVAAVVASVFAVHGVGRLVHVVTPSIPQSYMLVVEYAVATGAAGWFGYWFASDTDDASENVYSESFYTSYAALSGVLLIAPLWYVFRTYTVNTEPYQFGSVAIVLYLILVMVPFAVSYYAAMAYVTFRTRFERLVYATSMVAPITTYFVSFAYNGYPVLKLIEGDTITGVIGVFVGALLHTLYGVVLFFIVSVVSVMIHIGVAVYERHITG